jgi:S1-C subfamily serine protease
MRSYFPGIFASVMTFTVIGLLIGGFLFGTGTRSRAVVVPVGPSVITPHEPEKAPAEPHDSDGLKTISVRLPVAIKKLGGAEQGTIRAAFHLKIPWDESNTYYRSSGSGYLVAMDTLLTTAHVIPDGYDSTVLVYCAKRTKKTWGAVKGRLLDIDRERDLALIAVEGCPDTDPVTLSDDPLDPNEMLHVFGYRLGMSKNSVIASHWTCSYIPDADMSMSCSNHGSESAWIKMVSPHIVGITGVIHQGNSGGLVFRGDGTVVGMIVALHPGLKRSYMAPASNIKNMLRKHGLK